ncbi:hypothetical protein BJ742DRAFT_776670 [Cladochytrium replicatum]|nr:hypothetical protein BJ742DRAFT_776670 [Cladochytrium replicatum]
MSRGLHAGVAVVYLFSGRAKRDTYSPRRPQYPLNITTLPPDIIRRLGRLYKIPLFERADSIMVFHLVTTCVYVPILALIYTFVIRPMIKSLHDDTHRFAVMVFMIPPELLSNVKSLMQLATKRDGLISLKVREKRASGDIEKQINIKFEGRAVG